MNRTTSSVHSPRALLFVSLTLLAACAGVTDDEPQSTTQREATALVVTAPRVLHVCASGCAYASVQAAIDAAAPGDTVRLAGETFAGPIAIADKAIALRGDGPGKTTLSGGAPVLGVSCTTAQSILVTGLTIANGGGAAGGLVNDGCSLTVRDARITGNAVHASGAGVRNRGALVLADVRLDNNLARVGGGAIYNETGASLILRDGRVESNTAGIASGGGIANDGDLTVRDSVITGNTAKMGGGIDNAGTALVRDSTVVQNTARLSGGGIENSGTLKLVGSHIARNEATTTGGGLANDAGTVTFRDSDVVHDVPDDCSGVVCP